LAEQGSSGLMQEAALAEPVAQQERISSLDVLRGFALLGILVMNIGDYALPGNFDYNPSILGPLSKLNLWLWAGRFILFEGKMRALFSMLFGAGVILLTSRLEKGKGRILAIGLQVEPAGAQFSNSHEYLASRHLPVGGAALRGFGGKIFYKRQMRSSRS
jgi:hypothetical protein